MFIVLFLCVTLSSAVFADDKVTIGNKEFDGRVVEVVKALLQDEGFGNLAQTVSELREKVARQEKRIEFLEARDRRRGIVVEELLITVGNLQKKCEKLESKTIVIKQNEPMKIPDSNKDIGKIAAERRQIRDTENVGFTAYLDHNVDTMAHGHTIRLNQILLNDGSGYNGSTGVFTVPVSGVYLFNFHFNSHYRKTIVGLFVDGTNEVDAIAVPKDSSQEMMGGNTAVLRVTAGQSVWLEDIIVDDGEIFSVPFARYATFSGVLIYSN